MRSSRFIALFLLSILVAMLISLPVFGVREPEQPGKPNFDIRLSDDVSNRAGFVLRAPTPAQLAQADSLMREIPDLMLRWDGMSASPKWLAAPAGLSLSVPLSGKPEEVARAFLRNHAALYGLTPREVDQLEVTSAVPVMDGSADSGANVYFKQRIGRLEVYGGRANVNVAADNRVPFAGSSLYAAIAAPGIPIVAGVDAARLAAHDVYPDIFFEGQVRTMEKDGERRIVFEERGFARPPQARLVLFPEREGARLAWEVRLAEPPLETDYRILVDAVDSRILFRVNMTVYASARIIQAGHPDPEADEDLPPQYQTQTIPSSTPQSPNGWITGTGTDLAGNNATSHLRYWTELGLSEPSAIYDYSYNTPSSALVNAWWWANDAHDRFYAAGFDEAAGNYQVDNFGLGGIANDPMRVVSWTNGGRDNAFYSSSVDGGTSTINFFWVRCRTCGDHDGYPENGGERGAGFMRDVIVHEYAHGVSIRMVGGPSVEDCLYGTQSAAMGEGWSDLFAASFYDDPEIGGHFFEGTGWMRDPRHDVTYDDLCGVGDYGCRYHDDGMIWAGALWDLRQSMMALDPVNGLASFHRIIVKGFANTACYPDMIDARDGILQADTQLYDSAHHGPIWNVFAKRGMGYGASSTGEYDTNPVTSFAVKPGFECAAPAAPTGLSVTPSGSNSLILTYSAAGASAVEIWRDDADNPLDTYKKIAVTNNLSTYADGTVQGGKSYSYQVVALGSGGIYCRSSASAIASATATGTCSTYPVFDPQLAIADGASDCSLTLSWNPASQGCPGTGSPVVYTVYRGKMPGFEPSEKLLIARTTGMTFTDIPPAGDVPYYLVLAQHGMLDDPPDHKSRGSAQLMRWVPRLPALGRTTYQSWDFEAGASGWTTDNSADPNGGWTLVDPISTRYADALFAPETAPGGTGKAWVTGDPGTIPLTITACDSDGRNRLKSPSFDGTGGRTIFSFDYWAYIAGNYSGYLELELTSTGSSNVNRTVVGFMTVQKFETQSANGWQHAELDLSKYITPSSNMTVTFIPKPYTPFSEFGIDNVKIEQAAVCSRSGLNIQSVSIADGEAGWGNGNGVLEPGETARLAVTLKNNGTSTAIAPQGTLTGASPGVLIHEPAAGFPDIAAGATGASTGPGFTVTVPSGSCGDTLEFRFEFIDSSGVESHEVWTMEFGSKITDTVFSDAFETDKGWVVEGGGAGLGIWQRGDPVGTMDGSNQANPENDSGNDTGSSCYVTENGSVGGGANANDVDNQYVDLYSPLFDLSGYKRARLKLDLWYYDNSSSDYWQDYGVYLAYADDGVVDYYWDAWYQGASTGGWSAKNADLTGSVPMVPDVRLFIEAIDRDSSFYPQATDNIVEMGVDNVRVEADRQQCVATGINDPPNGVGSSLRVSKSGSNARITWNAPPVDATHDAAAYYELFVSSSPESGFSITETSTQLETSRPLAGSSEYYLITAVNAAGTSGDEPAP